MGDFFAGSVNSHKRNKSTASRSSTYTQSTGDGSLMRFSQRSKSTTTSATTVSSMDDDGSFFAKSPQRKPLKRSHSPGVSLHDDAPLTQSLSRSPSRPRSRASSRASSHQPDSDYSDFEDNDGTLLEHMQDLDSSDRNLALQLDLARRNSKSQDDKPLVTSSEIPQEHTIYEGMNALSSCNVTETNKVIRIEEPPHPYRPASRASRDSTSQCTVTQSTSGSPRRRPRSLSRHSSDRRPLGPRTPSPLPSNHSPQTSSSRQLPPEFCTDSSSPEPVATPARASGLPRSKRQPFYPVNSSEMTPKPVTANMTGSSVEPLSIKKKASVRSSVVAGSPSSPRKTLPRASPFSRGKTSPRRTSPQIKTVKYPKETAVNLEHLDRAIHLSAATKEDVSFNCGYVEIRFTNDIY
jgi:protein ECT2